MITYVKTEDVIAAGPARTGYDLINEENGAVNGCKCGVSIYRKLEYDPDGGKKHDDQEGFYVLEGKGYAQIEGKEYLLEPGVCILIPPGVQHTMRRDPAYEYCKVFWFHAAV